VVALGCALSVIGTSSIAGADLQSRIDAAKQNAQALEARIQARGEHIAGLEQQASQAQARIEALGSELKSGEQHSAELTRELGDAQHSLDESQGRLDRARAVLAIRLVDIYKHGEPDYLELVLSSDGFDDLTTRAAYLKAFEQADARVADRVRSLTAEVRGEVDKIAAVKSQIDDQNKSLLASQQDVADTRASLKQQAGQLTSAKAQESADLADIRSTISDLEAQIGPKQLGALFGNGNWSIPEYIVMCESGGNYHALNPSSGAGGAYQILPSTWQSYGGQGLPNLAPPAEQDRIAAQIWADSGPGAWSCA
jgi:peptidoglycan hydrolase CwlO-like protein